MKILIAFPFSDFVIAHDLASILRHLETLDYVFIDCSSEDFHADV